MSNLIARFVGFSLLASLILVGHGGCPTNIKECPGYHQVTPDDTQLTIDTYGEGADGN